MLIEYEDLVEQLKQFRLDVVKALAGIDAEIDALHKVALRQKPLLREDLNRLRSASRTQISKIEERYLQRITLLHERR